MTSDIKNNLGIMFEALSQAKPYKLPVLVSYILSPIILYLCIVMETTWFIYLSLIVRIISYYGLKSLLENMCNPYNIREYMDERKYTDKDILDTYTYIKQPQWGLILSKLSYISEVVILMMGGLFYTGLTWLVVNVVNDNIIYNNRKKMKSYWEEYQAA